MRLAEDIYVLAKKLPIEERYGIVSQIQRSAVSIPSNIAEGNKRGSAKDYVHFLRMASGSAAELETQLTLIYRIYQIDIQQHLSLLEEIEKMLESMKKRLLFPKTYSL